MKEFFERVSKNLFDGQQVPDDLQKLWTAQLEGRAQVFERLEVQFHEQLPNDFFQAYSELFGIEPYVVRAYSRMFEKITFFASTADGALIGFWQPENLAIAPLLELDNEGQFRLRGTSFAELILLAGDEEKFLVTKQQLEVLGIEITVNNQDEIYAKLEKFPSPSEFSNKFQAQELAENPS